MLIRKAVELSKIDVANRIVYATLLVPDKVDLQGDLVSREEIQRAAVGFMRNSQVVGEMHSTEAGAQVVQSWFGYDSSGLMGWHTATLVVEDALWLKVQDGTYKGMSIGAFANRAPEPGSPWYRLTELEVVEYCFVDVPAVQEAVLTLYKSAKADDEEQSLARKIAEGKVKPRVSALKWVCDQLKCAFKRLEAEAESTDNNSLAEGEISKSTKEVMDMTHDEFKAMLAEALAPMAEQLTALGKSFEEHTALPPAEQITAELVSVEPDPALKALSESVEALSAKVDKVLTLSEQSAPSLAIKSDGTTAGATQQPEYTWKR
jgi:hypothetical protein